MGSKKVVKKFHKKNTHLRLVKQEKQKEKKEQIEQKIRFGRVKRILILSAILVLLVVALASGYIYIVDNYTITTIYVEGNIHYTNEEIIEMVMDGRYANNSLFLSWMYRKKGIDDIPFVQTMDISVEAKDTIRIKVYEKAVAGYVAYLGRYMYFDKDGIIVESSELQTPGVPQVSGLTFGYVVMHEKLPVENPEIFEDILDITQLLNKYEIQADKILFDKSMRKTLYFGEARVSLGSNDNIGEKIMKLKAILPELSGKKGLLRMDNYSEEMQNITFEIDSE